ncbi:MAG: glycosyltransferase [bacterium]|nr:glycosyltransferase [bacterium]
MKASIIIPVYNAEKSILKTLEALEKQTTKDFEVIVVNDGSTDNSYKLVKEFKTKLKIRSYSQKNAGPAKARNLGAKNAKGDIVVFTDSDCIPNSNWLEEMLKPFKKKNVVGVEGTYRTLNHDRMIARYVGYEINTNHIRKAKLGNIDFIGTYSAAYRRKEFLAVGGFNTLFKSANAEDPELSFRLNQKGYNMVFNPRAQVWHPHPDTLLKYLKQQYGRGYWAFPLYFRHKDKFVKDSYSGYGRFFQTVLSDLFLLSFISLNFFIVLGFFLLIAVTNIPFAVFCLKREKKFFFIAPFLRALRSIIATIGANVYLVKLIFGRAEK